MTSLGLRGIDAVVDKDRASRLLATELGIEILVISTGVPNATLFYGTPKQKALENLSLDEAKLYHKEGHFPPGNMGPKIEAAIGFLEAGGKEAIITSPDNLTAAVFEGKGTHITPT